MQIYAGAAEKLSAALDYIDEVIVTLEDTGDLDWSDMLAQDYEHLTDMYRELRARARATVNM